MLNFDAEMLFWSCLLSVCLWFRVTPTKADTWTANLPSSVVGLSGSCVVIPCTFNYPAAGKTYTNFIGIWYKGYYESTVYNQDSSKISDEFRNRASLIGDLRQKNCSLKISSLRQTDNVELMFRIEIENLDKYTYDNKVSLQVKETAEQPSVSVEDELTSGEQVSATCAVSHSCPSDLPQVTWSHQGSHSGPSQPQDHGQWKLTSYSLTFTPSREDHNTRLNCTADFKGKTVTGYKTLTVKYPPYNVKVVTGPPVKENDSVTLTCSSDSNPTANSYEWFILNKSLVAKGSSYQLMKVSRHTEAIFCTAINTEGRNSSKPHQINVLYPPYNVKVVTGPPVKENDSVTLTCSSNGNPAANSYEWFSLNKSLLAKGSSYQLAKVSRHTEAISCTAINTEGRNSSDPQKLNILYPPDIKNESSCQSVSSTVCVCIVDSNPPSEVKWLILDSSKTFLSSRTEIIKSVSIFTLETWLGFPDTVQCVATNSVGSSSITLKAPLNGMVLYIAVASAVVVLLFVVGIIVYAVRRHRRKRAVQQPILHLKDTASEMKTANKFDLETYKNEEEKCCDEDVYTNSPGGHVYGNWGCEENSPSSDNTLEDESVYANT
ncbi:myelin-associated glycoprotein-like isoform X2 [Danio aesculapii]|uniref:myelin-associated glycoprotein-like isoform X2 n=1 Tax=Danio aesculapii TaxID=1142201 RepID=UPI0024C0D386|nr:myelin-associated glycoprotein-like isoform X2 [Danio aesculapii]